MCPPTALPTLDIAEGALDKIFGIYKELLPQLGGYLTHAGQLHGGRLEALLQRLALLEQETLEQRAAVSPFLVIPASYQLVKSTVFISGFGPCRNPYYTPYWHGRTKMLCTPRCTCSLPLSWQ